MSNQQWTQKFQEKIRSLNRTDNWSLEFDDTIEANRPAIGWKEYIRSPFSWFTCSICSHRWASSKTMVVFHMSLDAVTHEGKVKVRAYKQKCKKCPDALYEEPSVDFGNLNDMMDKLMEKIQIKCYGQPPPDSSSHYHKKILKGDHLSIYCEACQRGVCKLD